MRAPPPNGTNVLARGTYAVVIILSADQTLKRQCIDSYLAEAIGIKLLRLGPELRVTVKTVGIDEELGIRWDNLAKELHRRIIAVKFNSQSIRRRSSLLQDVMCGERSWAQPARTRSTPVTTCVYQ
jgi:hypothetical protein